MLICGAMSDISSATKIDRRTVLRASAIGAAAFSAGSYNRILGANEQIQLGLIGCGGRGVNVLGHFVKNEKIRPTALCDVYSARIDDAKSVAPEGKSYHDHEELLAQDDVDAVLVATPDHWHANIAIDAANAGKDIYVEKPLTLKIEEGPKIVKAVRLNERVCQVGMQQRSSTHYLQAKEKYFDSGVIGKVTMARTWWHGNGAHLKGYPPEAATRPSNLDWGRYLGPIKWRPYNPPEYFNFRAYLDYGGGQVTDLFTHWIDAVHLFMGQDDPVAAVSAGGIYHYKDGRTAPDTINCLLEYTDEWTATFEATLAPGRRGAAIEMVGTEGRLVIDRRHYEYYPKGSTEPTEVMEAQGDMTTDHVNNFIDCVQSREQPNGDVWIGHRSAQASHLANLAYIQKRRLKFDPQREEILPL